MSDRKHTLESDYFSKLLEGIRTQSPLQAKARYTLVPYGPEKNESRFVRLDVQLSTLSSGNMGQIPVQVIKIVKLKFNFDALQIPENLQEACVGVLWNRLHEDAADQVGKVCEALFRFPEFQAWFAPLFDKRVKVCLADLLEKSDWRATPWWPVRE